MFQNTPKIYILLFAFFFLATPIGLLGQVFGEFGGDITLTVSPNFPRANEEVSLELHGFTVDLDRAEISWFLNNKLISIGIGNRTFSFKTDGLGSVSSLLIVVEHPTSGIFRKTQVFRPADVDILWEVDTYVPPFYKGKKMPSSNSPVTLTAMPELRTSRGKKLDPRSLVYTWEQDRVILLNQSGYGKQSITVDGPALFQNTIISLEVSSFDGLIRASKTIFIEPFEPEILFYEKHPLRGILYNNAIIRSFFLPKEEFTLRGEPYFFSSDSFGKVTLDFGWTVNNSTILPTRKNELVLRKEGSGGSREVRLAIRDLRNLLQSAASILVQF